MQGKQGNETHWEASVLAQHSAASTMVIVGIHILPLSSV